MSLLCVSMNAVALFERLDWHDQKHENYRRQNALVECVHMY